MTSNEMEQKKRDDEFLAKNLQRLRAAAGLRQEDVVARMQLMGSTLSRTGYSKMECGIRRAKWREIVMLHLIYNVAYEEFFRGDEEKDISQLYYELKVK